MRIGYARVSTPSQAESLEAQRLELLGLGCEKVFADVASGAKAGRPGLTAALDFMREGDTLTVTRLDRLGRTTIDTLKTVSDLDARGIRVNASDLDLDTGTPAGTLVVSVLAALAEWERNTLRERTREGMAHARKNGRHAGRPAALTQTQADAALAALRAGMPLGEVAQAHGVSRWTLARLRDNAPEQ